MVSQVRNYKYAQDSHFDTWWVEDGSFIRGQNFVLGLTVPTSSTAKAKIQKLRFYVSAQNLFLITDYSGYDPEVNTFGGQLTQNQDFFPYPHPLVVNLGVNLSF